MARRPFQIGTIVRDIDAHVRREADLFGIGPWIDSGWMTADYWDAPSGRVLTVRHRAVFGRLDAHTALEFIEVDPGTEAPAVWDLDSTHATAHLGYWAADPRAAATALLAEGGELAMARVTTPEMARALSDRAPGDPPPEGLDMCYMATGAGLLVEFIPTRIWGGRLRSSFGDGLEAVLCAPPADLIESTTEEV